MAGADVGGREHSVVFVAYECLDEQRLVVLRKDEEFIERHDLMAFPGSGWDFAASAHSPSEGGCSFTLDDKGRLIEFKSLSLFRVLRCPNRECNAELGIECDVTTCTNCGGGASFDPSTGMARTRNARLTTQVQAQTHQWQLVLNSTSPRVFYA